MSVWVEAGDKHVNLDHVAVVQEVRADETVRFAMVLPDGQQIVSDPIIYRNDYWTFEQMVAPIIPAAPGEDALLVELLCEKDDPKLRPIAVQTTRWPVKAWRVVRDAVMGRGEDFVMPVLPREPYGSAVMLCLTTGSGGYYWVGNAERFATKEAMERRVLLFAQAEWDRAQRP